MKSIFGYQIATMYDFFMVFVVMSGVASLILLDVYKRQFHLSVMALVNAVAARSIRSIDAIGSFSMV